MDIYKVINKEHSKTQAHRIAHYVKDDIDRFNDLINIYLNGDYRVTQRAAWPLSICVERHPGLIKPHLKQLLDFAGKPDVHDAVKRNTMRLLQYCEIPKRLHGQVINLCFENLLGKDVPVAVKAFSITVAQRLISGYPDLRNELRVVLEDQLPYSSPAFVVRARKALNNL